jgi:hypothetical protein
MYQIKKFSDCWAVFNLDSELSRTLTEEEVKKVSREIPSLTDSETVSYFTDRIDCIEDLP